MYCTSCGVEMKDADRFCGQCGKAAGGSAPAQPSAPPRRLMRDMTNKKIAGVCAGIARHFEWDTTIVRVAFLAGVALHGFAVPAYIIAWICMPRDDIRTVPAAQAV